MPLNACKCVNFITIAQNVNFSKFCTDTCTRKHQSFIKIFFTCPNCSPLPQNFSQARGNSLVTWAETVKHQHIFKYK